MLYKAPFAFIDFPAPGTKSRVRRRKMRIKLFRSLGGRVVDNFICKKHVDNIGVAAAILPCVPVLCTTITDALDYFIQVVPRLSPIFSDLLLNAL